MHCDLYVRIPRKLAKDALRSLSEPIVLPKLISLVLHENIEFLHNLTTPALREFTFIAVPGDAQALLSLIRRSSCVLEVMNIKFNTFRGLPLIFETTPKLHSLLLTDVHPRF